MFDDVGLPRSRHVLRPVRAALGMLARIGVQLAALFRARSKAGRVVPAAAIALALDPALASAARSILQPAVPMSNDDHWRRSVRSLQAADASARAMRELHQAAGRQLDSVDYALQQLLDDLSAVMSVPRAPLASVHQMPAPASRPADGAGLGRSLAA